MTMPNWMREANEQMKREVLGTDEKPGAIRCLNCGRVYLEAPEGWSCTECGHMVSQHMGTIHVGSQPNGYGTEDVRKMVTLAVRDMVWFDQTTGDPKAFLPLAEKIVEHVTKNLCGAPEGWDVDAVDRQYEKLRELVGDHADADIRCAVANLRNANRILRLGGYYTTGDQRYAELKRRIDATMGPFDGAPYMRSQGRDGKLACVFCSKAAIHDADCPALMLRDWREPPDSIDPDDKGRPIPPHKTGPARHT